MWGLWLYYSFISGLLVINQSKYPYQTVVFLPFFCGSKKHQEMRVAFGNVAESCTSYLVDKFDALHRHGDVHYEHAPGSWFRNVAGKNKTHQLYFSRTKVYKFWGVAFYDTDLTLDIAVLVAAPFPLTLDIAVLLAAPFPPRTKL